MRLGDTIRAIEIRDRARDATNAVVGAGRQAKVAHGALEQALRGAFERAEAVEFAPSERRIRAARSLPELHARTCVEHARAKIRARRALPR